MRSTGLIRTRVEQNLWFRISSAHSWHFANSTFSTANFVFLLWPVHIFLWLTRACDTKRNEDENRARSKNGECEGKRRRKDAKESLRSGEMLDVGCEFRFLLLAIREVLAQSSTDFFAKSRRRREGRKRLGGRGWEGRKNHPLSFSLPLFPVIQ